MTNDRLSFLLQAPELVEGAVRAALRDVLDVRRFHNCSIDVRGFSNRALCELERAIAENSVQLDAVAYHELAAATVRAATCFASSRLARRLSCIPARRFIPALPTIDAIVNDACGNPHAVRLETFTTDEKRLAGACTVLRALRARDNALRAPSVHFFSLRDGIFRSFGIAQQARRQKVADAGRAA